MAVATKTVNVKSVVDKLGQVKAEIADLKVQENTLRDQLVETGMAEAEGKLFRATVSTYDVDKVDYEEIVSDLTALLTAGQLKSLKRITNRRTETKEKTTVKVVSR